VANKKTRKMQCNILWDNYVQGHTVSHTHTWALTRLPPINYTMSTMHDSSLCVADTATVWEVSPALYYVRVSGG
jgi:hypothetical protein